MYLRIVRGSAEVEGVYYDRISKCGMSGEAPTANQNGVAVPISMIRGHVHCVGEVDSWLIEHLDEGECPI